MFPEPALLSTQKSRFWQHGVGIHVSYSLISNYKASGQGIAAASTDLPANTNGSRLSNSALNATRSTTMSTRVEASVQSSVRHSALLQLENLKDNTAQ